MDISTVGVRREIRFSVNIILICENSSLLSLEGTQMMPVFLCRGFAVDGTESLTRP
jgi:hypothetical protein